MPGDAESRRIVADLAHGQNLDALDAIDAEELVAHIQRELADGGSDLSRPEIAAALIRLGDRRAGSEQPHEAVTATKQGVDLYRTLAVDQPDAHREAFAAALESLAVRLAALWLHEPALQANREARRIRRGAAIEG
ncbi:MAG: hypothetical protein O3C25_01190 [Chloroflexi bacterium]|nr:hypothetical protein [Chloroflexota bacterium]